MVTQKLLEELLFHHSSNPSEGSMAVLLQQIAGL
jgi:hypothetical protein